MKRLLLGLAAALLLVSCGLMAWATGVRLDRGFDWDDYVPAGLPTPRVPEDNRMTRAKVELGRQLFYDARLSGNGTQSCASCHRQELAFTDGRAHGIGSTGEAHARNSMSLANVAYAPTLTWASHLVDRLEDQALLPMFGDAPVELGLPDAATLVDRLAAVPAYADGFAAAFPDRTDPISVSAVTRAIAAFQRTLISANSPFDECMRGDDDALSASALRGMDLFFSERLECFHCHGGFNFSDSVDHAGLPEPVRAFHNTGLYDLDGNGAYPAHDRGLFELTGKRPDMGRFKAPTLRNIAVTAPYMHDGSIATLDEVIDHYANGGRDLAAGPYAGAGSSSPLKDEFMVGFVLEDRERDDLLAFLDSLTDEQFLTDPRFADPFRR